MQVNVATRDAALAPGGMDSMAFFEGSYSLMPLTSKTPMKPVEVLISTNNGDFQGHSQQADCLPTPSGTETFVGSALTRQRRPSQGTWAGTPVGSDWLNSHTAAAVSNCQARTTHQVQQWGNSFLLDVALRWLQLLKQAQGLDHE